MFQTKRQSDSTEEQIVLEEFQVRPLTRADELARCDELIVQEHYLHDGTLVGEHLRFRDF